MKIVLTAMVLAATLGSAVPVGAQQPLTPMQRTEPPTYQSIPPSPAPPTYQPVPLSPTPQRHVTRKRYPQRDYYYFAPRAYPQPSPVYYPPSPYFP